MRLQLNQTISAYDLPEALRENEGTFIVQQGGQTFLAIAARGHSIKSLRPVGPRIPQTGTPTAEPWIITKISNQEVEFEGDYQAQGRTQTARG